MEVDALVALEPDQARARRARQGLRHLGLADAGLTLEQQRLLQRPGQIDGGGKTPVREVPLPAKGLLNG